MHRRGRTMSELDLDAIERDHYQLSLLSWNHTRDCPTCIVFAEVRVLRERAAKLERALEAIIVRWLPSIAAIANNALLDDSHDQENEQ